MSRLPRRLLSSRFLRSEKGNVAVTFAISMVPMVIALGGVIDYSSAAQRRTHINAIADAAALAAVTPNMMSKSFAVAQAQAVAFFDAQMSSVKGIGTTFTVTATGGDTTVDNAKMRTITVTYTVSSINAFGSILGLPTTRLVGSSTSSATVSPNIDFYLMIDTSPSMTIAATQSGINLMVQNTTSQSGCAFACHESHPSSDNLGNPNGEDNYALARNLGVTLRMDMVTSAVSSMISTAQTTASNTGAAYRVAGYTFDVAVNNPIPLTSILSTAQSESSNIAPLEVYNNNCLTTSNCNSDMDTNFDLAFGTLNTAMPTPGNGTNAVGDTPQEVLFIVTDGVSDESYNGNRIYTPFGENASWCQTIKNRNIRIAVLYTTYNPLPTNGWYNTYISGEQPSIATTAQACASPGLYFEVNTGGDITGAMNTLFQTAVASAHLTQ